MIMEGHYVAVVTVYKQCSSDYMVDVNTKTRVVPEYTTVKELFEWYDSLDGLGKDRLILTRPDQADTNKGK